jgi:hypothetical protein
MLDMMESEARKLAMQNIIHQYLAENRELPPLGNYFGKFNTYVSDAGVELQKSPDYSPSSPTPIAPQTRGEASPRYSSIDFQYPLLPPTLGGHPAACPEYSGTENDSTRWKRDMTPGLLVQDRMIRWKEDCIHGTSLGDTRVDGSFPLGAQPQELDMHALNDVRVLPRVCSGRTAVANLKGSGRNGVKRSAMKRVPPNARDHSKARHVQWKEL